MATQNSKKKGGKPPAKKLSSTLKAVKKVFKRPQKKLSKKPMKPSVMLKEPEKVPAPIDENEATRNMLLGMREKLIADISENLKPESLAIPADTGDLLDQAGDERDRELSLILTDRDKEKLLAINEALEKLEEGSYGICEECGEKIGRGRLKVMPLAKFCVNCQSKFEKEISLRKKMEEGLKYQGLAFSTGMEEEET